MNPSVPIVSPPCHGDNPPSGEGLEGTSLPHPSAHPGGLRSAPPRACVRLGGGGGNISVPPPGVVQVGLTCLLLLMARQEQETPNWKMKTRPRMIMYWGGGWSQGGG